MAAGLDCYLFRFGWFVCGLFEWRVWVLHFAWRYGFLSLDLLVMMVVIGIAVLVVGFMIVCVWVGGSFLLFR